MPYDLNRLLARIDPATGEIAGRTPVIRRLSDLRGCFADATAYAEALARGDPVIYTVSSVERGSGPGDLSYGVGRILPGKIGREYFLTKGHLHTWREAAELYVGLAGAGMILLEDFRTGESRALDLLPSHVVYVPGHAAHRTVNTGPLPLVYLGIYPAAAGHDYGVIEERNFRCVIVEQDGRPVSCERTEFIAKSHQPAPRQHD